MIQLPPPLFRALADTIPGFDPAQIGASWKTLGLDSFDLINLRLAVEQALGGEVADVDWVTTHCPADLLSLAPSATATGAGPDTRFALSEQVTVAMPQMAMSGLSEAWLIQLFGDLHWRLLGRAFDGPMTALEDSTGSRLYAAFSCVAYESSVPLRAIGEGTRLMFDAALSRFGSGIFMSEIVVSGDDGSTIAATLMSRFARRGPSGSNADLLAGTPAHAPSPAVPSMAALPPFAAEHQRRRAEAAETLPSRDTVHYDLQPPHDVNGVGLIYYAAFPAIEDLCQMRREGRGPGWTMSRSTLARNLHYYANAAPTTPLRGRAIEDADDMGLATRSVLVRDSDGVALADLTTRRTMV